VVSKIEKRSLLVEQAADQIREAISTGSLKSGDRLIESELAGNMGIGRNALREAIRYLEKEGSVITTPFKGAHVKEFAEQDFGDLYAVRMALEELAIRTIVKNLNDEKIRRLEAVVAGMKRVANGGSIEEIIEADLGFHRAICEVSGNRRLLESWQNLSYQLRSFIGWGDHLYDDDTPETVLGLHYPILDAIKAGKGNMAVKLMRITITRGYEKALRHFERGGE